jgi:beta-galactosidase GanA
MDQEAFQHRVRRPRPNRVAGARVAGGLAVTLSLLLTQNAFADMPRLETQGSAQRLVVDGKPMLVLGGELGNSSASSQAYMARYWPKLKAMNLNTVLAPVSWELIEPKEGVYDFSSVDGLLKDARAQDMRLVILWFGAWKNSMSTYVPSWVKRDDVRFPRAKAANGVSQEILSAFSTNTRDADAKAYAALLAHLKAVDAKGTVLMVQVENEIGMLPVAREWGPEANAAWAAPVPAELLQRLSAGGAAIEPELRALWQAHGAKTSGTWSQVFGDADAGQEVFTAWFYARYTDAVTRAGKAAYPLPMYVNVALNRAGKAPGEYPSGGPLPHLIDVWKTGAPSLDLISPDIYFPNFNDLAGRYKRPDNALFIPEANNVGAPETPANAFYAIGKLDAFGFSPFQVENAEPKEQEAVAQAYGVLKQLTPAILAAQGLNRMSGFKPRVLEDGTVLDQPVGQTIGDYKFTVGFVDPWTPRADQKTAGHGGMIIQIGPEEYLMAGRGLVVTFAGAGDGASKAGAIAGIDSAVEGVFDAQGRWVPGRTLNGDQTHQGRHIRLPPDQFQIQRVKLYRYR